MSSSRRAFLASGVGSLVALAGCVARSSSESPATTNRTETTGDSTVTETPGLSLGDTFEANGLSVTPRDAHVRHSFLHLTTPDTMGVTSPEGRQFVFVGVSATVGDDGSPPSPGDFELVAGDRTFRGRTEFDSRRPYTVSTAVGDRPYATDDPVGWVGFDLPAPFAPNEVRLALNTGDGERPETNWGLPADPLADLRSPPPSFELVEFSVPERVSADEAVDVSFAVRNVGDGDGVFRASLNQTGPLYAPSQIRLVIPSGERAEWRSRISGHLGTENEVERVSFGLQHPGGSVDRTVAVGPSD